MGIQQVVRRQPQPGPQMALPACSIEDAYFGGARGGGKTDGLLGDWMSYALEFGVAARGIIFRKSYPELEEIEARSREIYGPIGWQYKAHKKTWISREGARLKLRQMEKDTDADRYQGHSYSYIGWDELGGWASSGPVDKLCACLRSAAGVPCLWRATGNPGGKGHNWVKARFGGEQVALKTIAQTVVSIGLNKVLQWFCEWVGVSEPASIQLNTEFFDQQMDPAMLRELVTVWQGGGMAKATPYYNMERSGITRPGVDSEQEQAEVQMGAVL